jgi:hypothetical protein
VDWFDAAAGSKRFLSTYGPHSPLNVGLSVGRCRERTGGILLRRAPSSVFLDGSKNSITGLFP